MSHRLPSAEFPERWSCISLRADFSATGQWWSQNKPS